MKFTASYQQTPQNYLKSVITSSYKLDRDFQEPLISNRFNLSANELNNSQQCRAKNVGSCCVRLHVS